MYYFSFQGKVFLENETHEKFYLGNCNSFQLHRLDKVVISLDQIAIPTLNKLFNNTVNSPTRITLTDGAAYNAVTARLNKQKLQSSNWKLTFEGVNTAVNGADMGDSRIYFTCNVNFYDILRFDLIHEGFGSFSLLGKTSNLIFGSFGSNSFQNESFKSDKINTPNKDRDLKSVGDNLFLISSSNVILNTKHVLSISYLDINKSEIKMTDGTKYTVLEPMIGAISFFSRFDKKDALTVKKFQTATDIISKAISKTSEDNLINSYI